MASITGKDIQGMVNHWLGTPVCGYLGSDYGQDAKSMLQRPQIDSGADAFVEKLRSDIPVVDSLPHGSVSLYGSNRYPDGLDISLDVAGQLFEVPV